MIHPKRHGVLLASWYLPMAACIALFCYASTSTDSCPREAFEKIRNQATSGTRADVVADSDGVRSTTLELPCGLKRSARGATFRASEVAELEKSFGGAKTLARSRAQTKRTRLYAELPELRGACDPEEVHRTFDRVRPDLEACFDAFGRPTEVVSGAEVVWEISATGHSRAMQVDARAGDAGLRHCLTYAFAEKESDGAAESGGICQVRYRVTYLRDFKGE